MSAERPKDATGYEFRGFVIPAYMGDGLNAYIEQGRPVGDFLTAVLSNDLMDAIGRADAANMANLPAYAGYLWNEAPRACYGSREAVAAWIAKHRAARQAAAPAASEG